MLDQSLKILPSLLAADFAHLEKELASVKTGDILHFDVMDGHFVPNLSFGLDMLRTVKRLTQLPIDVHLMISNPDEMIERYIEAGADYVTFHIEATNHAHRLIQTIKARGVKAGIAINPGTSLTLLDACIQDVDMVLLMSVNPGFGGQSFIEHSYKRLRRLRRMCDEHGVQPHISVDGGVTLTNASALVAAGADMLVAGSFIFASDDRQTTIQQLRDQATLGLVKKG